MFQEIRAQTMTVSVHSFLGWKIIIKKIKKFRKGMREEYNSLKTPL
jgi:hypothetical protein